MAALPTVGGSNNTWGTELNEFLQVSHASDGRISVTNTGAGNIPLKIRGSASQTALLFRIETSAAAGRVGVLNDGSLMVTDTDGDLGITAGTSAGSIITGHNRFFRTVNAAHNSTIRLIGINESNVVVIGGEPVGTTILADSLVSFNHSDARLSWTSQDDAGNAPLTIKLTSDTQERFIVRASGQLEWGPGGSTSPDTNLYRQGVEYLRTDDAFYANSGLGTKTKAGIPTDSDIPDAVESSSIAMLIVDTSNNRLYVRCAGTWRYAALT